VTDTFFIYAYVSIHMCIYICTRRYVCFHVFVDVCTHTHVYVYVNRHNTHANTHKNTLKEFTLLLFGVSLHAPV